MTTPKPLPVGKSKAPIYYKEVVHIYAIVKLKAKGVHNPADALQEVNKYASTKADKKAKKSVVKATLTADEDSLNFKKKGLFGKAPPLKKVTYDTVQAFYRFLEDPAFLVIGLKGKTGPCHYIVVATPTQEQTTSLLELLQAAQWAPQNNLKNAIPAVDITKQNNINDASESSNSEAPSKRERSLSSNPNPLPPSSSSQLQAHASSSSTSSSSSTASLSLANNDQLLKSAHHQTPSPLPISLSSSLRRRKSSTIDKELSISFSPASLSRPSSVNNVHLPPKGSTEPARLLSKGEGQYIAFRPVKPKLSSFASPERSKGPVIGKPKISCSNKETINGKVAKISHTKAKPEKSGIFLFTDCMGKPSDDDSQPKGRKLSSRLYYRSDNGEFVTDNGSEKAKFSSEELTNRLSHSRSNSSSTSSSSTSSRNDLKGNKPPVYWIK